MFRSGQKVVCIGVQPQDVLTKKYYHDHPKKGDIVTIDKVDTTTDLFDSRGWLFFQEYNNHVCYEPWNFKPLITDRAFAEEIIESIQEFEHIIIN